MVPTQPEEWNERLAAILTISQKMNSERDLGALLDLIAREATNVLLCDRASIFLLDRERNELWSKVALGSDEILRFPASSGIAGHRHYRRDHQRQRRLQPSPVLQRY